MTSVWHSVVAAAASVNPVANVRARWRLSRAKHPSLRGHARIARRVAGLLAFYEYDDEHFFSADGAPPEVADRRRAAFERLASQSRDRAPRTLAAGDALELSVSDASFVNAYRVPFQFRNRVRSQLRVGTFVDQSKSGSLRDLDGNWSHDLGGAYGVNLFGYEFYKQCIVRGVERVRDLGPVLGPYHPIVADNAERLKALSGMDEVSFHMSGTEAVMQAVRLARYHTGRSHVVRFCGSYHGWWDGVHVGVGNPRPAREVYTLKEMDEDTLRVLRTRDDIACVLVNPIQAMHPNANAPTDSMLVGGDRISRYDREAYASWLEKLRDVCDERSIVLILDEVFLGFRLAIGGAQEFFGVRADLVTYGKTLGGGLPIGVVCGRRHLMRRFRDDRPSDVCFARGTFNSHPYVMATMNEFLTHLARPEVRAGYVGLEHRWNSRARMLNDRLGASDLPVGVDNMVSVWTTLYRVPSRYHWMFQYYLRAEGLSLSWIGTGRIIFSHDLSDADFREICDRFVAAAVMMRDDGWWWRDATVTQAAMRRQLVREMLSAALVRGPSDQATLPRSSAAESGSTAQCRETDP